MYPHLMCFDKRTLARSYYFHQVINMSMTQKVPTCPSIVNPLLHLRESLILTSMTADSFCLF